jgi:hypothetical protein
VSGDGTEIDVELWFGVGALVYAVFLRLNILLMMGGSCEGGEGWGNRCHTRRYTALRNLHELTMPSEAKVTNQNAMKHFEKLETKKSNMRCDNRSEPKCVALLSSTSAL